MIFELLVNSMMNLMKKPRRSVEAAPLTFGSRSDPLASSGVTLSLLDIEAGTGVDPPAQQHVHDKRRNGYLSVPSSHSSDSQSRSRSTSPLFLNHTFTFPSPKTGPAPAMRFVSKTGECNVRHSNVKRKGYKYLADIFTTLVDCKWRWCALIFACGFFSTWLLYAFMYFFFAWLHDDLTKGNLTEQEWTPCINKIKDFTSAFLYSLETQHTIGYGYRFANTECPHVIIVLCFQCLTGVALQSILVGVLFAKLSRPKMRSETLMFSKEACVCQRDGKMHFQFRIGDMRRSHLVEAHIRVMCIKERLTAEGEEIPFYTYDMDVGFSDGTDRLFLVWPNIITHEIDERSPLFEYSADNILHQRLEIIVILEGIVEATGLTTQARTSYLPSEIRWGSRFEKVVRPGVDGVVRIDHDYFDKFQVIDSTPRCSPKELLHQLAQQRAAEEKAQLDAGLPIQPVPPPLPRPQYRRRSCTPQVALLSHRSSVDDHEETSSPGEQELTKPKFDSLVPVGNDLIRRCSTPGLRDPAFHDPLNGASTSSPAIAVHNVELPRIRS